MRSSRWQVGALVAGGVAVAAMWGGVVMAQPEPIDAPSTSATTPDEPPAVLFVGDSYTAGAGATTPEGRWSAIAAGRLGWMELNAGVGGTGYVAAVGGEVSEVACGADRCDAYPDRIAALGEQYDPDMVVLSGGRNDAGATGVAAGVTTTVHRLEAEFPDARLVLVAPWWDSGEPPPNYVTTRREILTAAERVRVDMLDTGEPLRGEPQLVGDDGIHPNDAGHEALATAFVEAWRTRG